MVAKAIDGYCTMLAMANLHNDEDSYHFIDNDITFLQCIRSDIESLSRIEQDENDSQLPAHLTNGLNNDTYPYTELDDSLSQPIR